MNGIGVIWRRLGNKYCVMLFTILWAVSLFLDITPKGDFQFLISSLMLGGIMFFLVLAIFALIPPLEQAMRFVQKSALVQSVLFVACGLVAPFILLASRVLASFLIFSGFVIWVVVQGLLACGFAYAVSARISVRSSRGLGMIFLLLALLVEAFLFIEAPRDPMVRLLLIFYTAAWLVPCLLLALVEWRSPRLFSTYSLIALVYTAFPVAYRLLSLLSGATFPFGTLSPSLSSLVIEEAITIFLFIWALNAAGNLLGRRYGDPKVGGNLPEPMLSSKDSAAEPSEEDGKLGTQKHEADHRNRFVLAPFLIFGLFYSGLAYFAFVHARGPFGILDYLEPSIGFVISVLAAIPLLFYILRKSR